MISSLLLQSPSFYQAPSICNSFLKTSGASMKIAHILRCHSSFTSPQEVKKSPDDVKLSLCSSKSCLCGRRHFIEAASTAFLRNYSSKASESPPHDSEAALNRFHPPRPDWYQKLYAFVLDKAMKSYEAKIAGLKSQLLSNLRGKAETILEMGIGTGPNLKYYVNENVHVFGVDPNRQMEKYCRAAAEAAGLPPPNFKFFQSVAESLPVSDESVDAVIGTLVLCSVKDVNLALQEVRRVLRPGGLFLFIEHVAAEDGTFGRFVQGVFDPLQQALSDGCHLTRKTENYISEAGFASLDITKASVPTILLTNPHVYGIAYK